MTPPIKTADADTGIAIEPKAISKTLVVAIVGNPNCGKTTLFNALTGLRQKVGNYPGVTVEKKEGRAALPGGKSALLLDLPGLYSLTPHSPDEAIAREILMGLRDDTPAPDVILNVVDASNLERNLYITSQLLDLGVPMVIALTMTDTADKSGLRINAEALAKGLGVPVCPVLAHKREGLAVLLAALQKAPKRAVPEPSWQVAPEIAPAIEDVKKLVQEHLLNSPRAAFAEAVTLLMQEHDTPFSVKLPDGIRGRIAGIRKQLEERGVDYATAVIEARYAWSAGVCEGVIYKHLEPRHGPVSTNERVDSVVMHPFLGYVIFFTVMAIVFQSIFTFAQVPMDWIKNGVDHLGVWLTRGMPAGDLRDLVKDGILGGVGNTIVFLPQIVMLFFFISLLEDTGYMARAAFLMDRLMSKVGLHGKSFIPLLSSFACAIPGIMATRTIGDRKARLITTLVAPLMSCSARIPVYTLMIGAFIPRTPVIRIGSLTLMNLQGATILSMYFLGMIAAFCISWLFHRTLLKGVSPTFLMELPPYRLPSLKSVVLQMIERAGLFLKRAGTVILAVSVVLWFLSTYPKHPGMSIEQQAEHSFAGSAGRALEPVIKPLGFDWKMGIGIVSSFAAREVFVTAMGTVYNVQDAEESGKVSLQQKMRDDRNPRTGKPVFSPLVAVSLMIYYVLAMQCMSTVAVVRRETGGWKWALFQVGYMTGLAWVVSFLVFQGGRLLGWG